MAKYVEIDISDLVKFQKRLGKFEENLGNKKKANEAFGRWMAGEIRRRAKKSETGAGVTWKGILASSAAVSNRSKAQRNRARKIANRARKKGENMPRMPLNGYRPLLTEGGMAAEASYKATYRNVTINPEIDGRGSKFSTILIPHHRPEFTGHARSGKKNMPDRSFFYMMPRDLTQYTSFVEKGVELDINKLAGGF